MVIMEEMTLNITLNGMTENATKVGMFLIIGLAAVQISIMPSQFIPYSVMYAGNIR